MDELIWKQDAIDVICTDCCGGNRDYDCRFYSDCDNLKSIKTLPSVQSMLSESDRIICKMYLNDRDKFKTCNEYKMLMRLIDNSVQPKYGKWNCTDDIYETAECSCCKWDSGEAWDYVMVNFKFCPNCGADMRGDENGTD